MRKRIEKLTLHRETLRHLNAMEIQGARGRGGAEPISKETNPSIQSGETYCWCTDTCDTCIDWTLIDTR